MVKLYHYTDTKGKVAIEASKFIKKSFKSNVRDDAQYGTGVYLTSLGPENRTDVILGNNWDGRAIPDHMKSRVEWYFEFDSDEADIVGVEQVSDKRDIWILRGKDLVCNKKAGKRRL